MIFNFAAETLINSLSFFQKHVTVLIHSLKILTRWCKILTEVLTLKLNKTSNKSFWKLIKYKLVLFSIFQPEGRARTAASAQLRSAYGLLGCSSAKQQPGPATQLVPASPGRPARLGGLLGPAAQQPLGLYAPLALLRPSGQNGPWPSHTSGAPAPRPQPGPGPGITTPAWAWRRPGYPWP
jgi:hypothetical protein